MKLSVTCIECSWNIISSEDSSHVWNWTSTYSYWNKFCDEAFLSWYFVLCSSYGAAVSGVNSAYLSHMDEISLALRGVFFWIIFGIYFLKSINITQLIQLIRVKLVCITEQVFYRCWLLMLYLPKRNRIEPLIPGGGPAK